MHPRVSLHQVAFMAESTDAFLGFCREAGFANAVLAAPKLRVEGFTALKGDMPRIASLNDIFDAANFHDTVDLAAQIGATSLYLLTGGRGAHDWEGAARHFAQTLAPGMAAARTGGLSVMIENAPALYADIHFAHTLADTIRLAEQADTGICIELFACWAEAGLKTLFGRAMPRCGLVQVSDYMLGDRSLPARAVPGDGVIPLERLIGDVLDAGYQGVFDIELVGPRIAAEGPHAASMRAGDYMSALLAKLGA